MIKEAISPGHMVFLREGGEAVGAVRGENAGFIIVYVENARDFEVPRTAVRGVHDGKVLLDPRLLDRDILDAMGHQHDAEDPRLAG